MQELLEVVRSQQAMLAESHALLAQAQREQAALTGQLLKALRKEADHEEADGQEEDGDASP